VRQVDNLRASDPGKQVLVAAGKAHHLVGKHRPANEQLIIFQDAPIQAHRHIHAQEAVGKRLDPRRRDGAQVLQGLGVIPGMIVDVALAAEAVSNRVADQVRKAGVIERPMGAQRHDIVQRRHPWSQVLGKEIKKAGHGHGARAIGDDDQHSTAINLQTIGPT